MSSAVLTAAEVAKTRPPSKVVTEFQKRCLAAIDMHHNGCPNINELAWHLSTSKLAIYSAMKSLEMNGIVHSLRDGDDKWAVLAYGYDKSIFAHGITVEGK